MNHSEYRGTREEFAITQSGGVTQSTGEFTPTVVVSTGTVTLNGLSVVRWCITGAIAVVNCHILVSSVASPTGSLSIRGFPNSLIPFNGGNASQGFMSCAVFGSGFTAGLGGNHLEGELFNGPPVSLTVSQLAAGSVSGLASVTQAGSNLEVMATYRVS